MRLLSRAEVAGAGDYRTEDVEVPEWGEGAGVRVKTLTCAEHRAFAEGKGDADDDGTVSAHLAVACAIDAAGCPLFTRDDVPMLLGKSSGAVRRIGRAAARLNRMIQADREDLRKNSPPTPS